ncbi:endonuclease VII domain-containing protein [Mycobacterium avium]|uniref:endonuclease VII domain-containing protein n=1 Tax=Mycobacterium avium TaxID=1764 RepID=UPI001CDA992C|nr:endonuclease VII domain-containing protein [Mycobacterium avium]MCA2331875.1 endonuclease VII domain-containing protein [Mycobacterium avium]
MSGALKPCIDCKAEGITTKRKPALKRDGTQVPGGRCVTHERARKSKTRDSAWERRLMAVYGLTAEQYWEIYEYQGGKCYICQRATGARKKLSVDHDHETGFVRGLCCGPCNRDVLGHLRDSTEALWRAITYLIFPPAQRLGIYVVAPCEAENLTTSDEAA